MFYVGQKVCCVYINPQDGETGPRARIGAVYTIAEIFASESDGEEMLQFKEMRFDGDLWFEPGWPARNFRPVVDRKTDISIFKAMLNPSKQGADA